MLCHYQIKFSGKYTISLFLSSISDPCVHENQYLFIIFFAHFKFPWEYSLLYFYGNPWWRLKFIMRILFDVNMISILVLLGLFFGKQEQWNN